MKVQGYTVLRLITYIVLVKFGFSALSVPRFFRRLVLDLVLKTSNTSSARLVLLKFNKSYAK